MGGEFGYLIARTLKLHWLNPLIARKPVPNGKYDNKHAEHYIYTKLYINLQYNGLIASI